MRCFKIAVALSVLTAAMVPARAGDGFGGSGRLRQNTGGWSMIRRQWTSWVRLICSHMAWRASCRCDHHIQAPQAGNYRVWVRTIDWVARCKAPGAPGKFQVMVGGNARVHFRHRRRRLALAGRRNRRT